MQQLSINNCDILVSFDASSLFTNVPLEETIQLLTDIAFTNNWFNETYQLHLSRQALLIFSEQQLKINFSFSMAGCMNTVSLWDPHLVLYSLTCLCVALKKGLEKGRKMLAYYRRSVDDTPTVMPNKTSAENLLETLNQCHSSVMFTMENESNGYFPSWAPSSSTDLHVLETKVFVKPRNTGLLLHYKSHVDVRYKPELPKTMLDHAFRLSSNWLYFFEECDRLKLPFFALKYSDKLIQSTISRFIATNVSDQPVSSPRLFLIHPTLFVLFYNLKTSPQLTLFDVNFRTWVTKFTRPCLQCLSAKRLKAILICHKLSHLLSNNVKQQHLVYKFECDLCDAGYVGYTSCHLHQRIEEHKSASSSIGQHFRVEHSSETKDLWNHFSILKTRVKANLTAWCLKCFLLMNWDLVSTYNQTHFVQKFLNTSFN